MRQQLVLLFLCSLAGLVAHAAAGQTIPLDSLRVRAGRAIQARHYPEAALLLQQQALAEPSRAAQADAYYNVACTLALSGQPAAALRALAAAQQHGFNQVAQTREDSDLASLRPTPEFARIVGRMTKIEARQADPQNAKLVTSDITLFWRAYDLAAKDPAHQEEIYQREYFDKGSPGLQDYFQLKITSAKLFVKNQRAKPAYYRAIRANTLRIATLTPQIRAGFIKLKALYPEAHFPNVYFVVGRLRSVGTVSGTGMLIGADQLCRTPDTPLGELSLWERNNIGALDDLPGVVAHEHIHYIQKPSNDPSLLRGALNEGMADFMAELVTGRNTNARLQAYGLAHEKQIWADFSREMGVGIGKTGLPTPTRKPPTSPPTWATSWAIKSARATTRS